MSVLKCNRSGGGSGTDLSNLLLPEIDESFEGSYRSCAWEEQGRESSPGRNRTVEGDFKGRRTAWGDLALTRRRPARTVCPLLSMVALILVLCSSPGATFIAILQAHISDKTALPR